jgi:hypothetical protein
VGLTVFLITITADGHPSDNPRSSRTGERALRKTQRWVARRTQGSRRRRKAIALLRCTHQQVQRQRRDFHHQTALALLQQYDVISLEDMQVRKLVRNHHLATSISDACMATVSHHPHEYNGRRWRVGRRGAPCVHQPELQWGAARWQPLCAAGSDKLVGAHPTYPRLSVLIGWCSTAMRTRR